MERDFEAELDSWCAKIRACQERKGLDSCLPCELVLECADRQNFVQSVHASMNKGKQGNFDF
ncbi:hypothetical protein [Helicobacter mehlei]|uniref:Uncharacterized protein n=1 Tax=Helicobacter mehlei TaxID=2316080 RepID=A0A553UQ96_9HELI|nr:hypothetical protein [Helicobacter mehlei]TSA82384.1 hypothetical protein FNE76_05860 [Helicobacter mehlei]